MTLEQLQAEVLALKEKLTQAETERDQFKTKNVELSTDLERVRAHNLKLFEKVSNQILTEPTNTNEPDDKKAPTCEEFALGLKI